MAGAEPEENPPAPSARRPRAVFDSHLHIIDPRFPLVANDGYLPAAFTVADYRDRTRTLALLGGAVVSGSFQGFDQTYLVDALGQLGAGFVGVTQLPHAVSDEEVLALDAAGVRAVRFNLRRGGSEGIRHLSAMAARLHELAGWHVELYADAADLGELADTVAALPAASVDHLGLSREGLPLLARLAERGVRIKATGFGRVDFEVAGALRTLYAANPAALLFGTDLPSTRARRPFADGDVERVFEALGDAGAEAVCWRNAWEFYRLPGAPAVAPAERR